MSFKFISKSFLLLLIITGFSVNAYSQLPLKGLCAHRGAMETHPENTLPAFKAAINAGAQMIEFDVWLTKDKEMVVLHDETVDRTTNGTGKVANLTLDEIKKLDAGSWKSTKFSGVKIPTLEETLAIMPFNIWLNIHIKAEGELPIMIAKMVKNKQRLHQSFLACSLASSSKLQKIIPEIKCCNMDRKKILDKYVNQTIAHRSEFIQILKNGPAISQKHITKLKSSGVNINYYKGDNIEEVKKLFDLGVDFPLVNDIVGFMEHAQQLKLEPITPIFSPE